MPQKRVKFKVTEIPVDKVIRLHDRAREPAGFQQIVDSIAEIGVKVPILVRPAGKKFELASGYGRHLACMRLKKKTIPAIIREMDDDEFMKAFLIENEVRKSLPPYQRALLMSVDWERKIPIETIAETYHMHPVSAKRYINILRGMSHTIRRKLDKGEIALGDAGLLVGFTEREQELLLEHGALKSDELRKATHILRDREQCGASNTYVDIKKELVKLNKSNAVMSEEMENLLSLYHLGPVVLFDIVKDRTVRGELEKDPASMEFLSLADMRNENTRTKDK